MTRARAALAAIIVVTLAGCGDRRGRQVADAEHANLIVKNGDTRRVAVYIGDHTEDAAMAGRLGEVEAGAEGYFNVERGRYKVYVRRHGESFFWREEKRTFRKGVTEVVHVTGMNNAMN